MFSLSLSGGGQAARLAAISFESINGPCVASI